MKIDVPEGEQRSIEEIIVLTEYDTLSDAVETLTRKIDSLPRCNVDDGGHGPCQKHLGHRGDHGVSNWEWPNFGPDGKRWRR